MVSVRGTLGGDQARVADQRVGRKMTLLQELPEACARHRTIDFLIGGLDPPTYIKRVEEDGTVGGGCHKKLRLWLE